MDNLTRKVEILECIHFQEVCPQCKNEINVNLLCFKKLNVSTGLIFDCPHCFCEYSIDSLTLKTVK